MVPGWICSATVARPGVLRGRGGPAFRVPVCRADRDDIVGILLAKDLLAGFGTGRPPGSNAPAEALLHPEVRPAGSVSRISDRAARRSPSWWTSTAASRAGDDRGHPGGPVRDLYIGTGLGNALAPHRRRPSRCPERCLRRLGALRISPPTGVQGRRQVRLPPLRTAPAAGDAVVRGPPFPRGEDGGRMLRVRIRRRKEADG